MDYENAKPLSVMLKEHGMEFIYIYYSIPRAYISEQQSVVHLKNLPLPAAKKIIHDLRDIFIL